MTIPKRNNFYSTPKASEYEEGSKATPDKSKVIFDRYSIIGDLGKGSYGCVYKVLLEPQGVLCAMKAIPFAGTTEEKRRRILAEAENEVALMALMRHPNVVSLLGCKREPTQLCIFMELVGGNSLEIYRNRSFETRQPLSESVIQSYIKQLLRGLMHCHSKKIIHRDIKCKNILLAPNGIIKIADFGSGKLALDSVVEDTASPANVTLLYSAPEVILAPTEPSTAAAAKPSPPVTDKCDVWSLALVAVELSTGRDPWAEKKYTRIRSLKEFLAKAVEANKPPEIEVRADMSDEFKAFVNRCLAPNPAERPDALTLWTDPWIQMRICSPPLGQGPGGKTGGALSGVSTEEGDSFVVIDGAIGSDALVDKIEAMDLSATEVKRPEGSPHEGLSAASAASTSSTSSHSADSGVSTMSATSSGDSVTKGSMTPPAVLAQ